jgi:hypothetical protein
MQNNFKGNNVKKIEKKGLVIRGEVYKANLLTEHVFELSDILFKMDVDPRINIEGTENEMQIGIKVMPAIFTDIIKKIGRAKEEVFNFLGSVYEKDVEKIKKIGFANIIKLIYSLKENEEITSFFSSLDKNQEKN